MQANTPDLTNDFLELVRRAATILPNDMRQALGKAKANEEAGSAAEGAGYHFEKH
jgi:tartrate dehydratase alpha subunit/fumarate hydratase class I-like protein